MQQVLTDHSRCICSSFMASKMLMKAVLGQLVIRLARPVIDPLRKLSLQFAGSWFTVWAALILTQFAGKYLNTTSTITMTANRAIYQHFSQDDIPIDKGLERIKRVGDTWSAPALTPLLNPHQEQILRVPAVHMNLVVKVAVISSRLSRFVLLLIQIILNRDADFWNGLAEICYPSGVWTNLFAGKILGTIIKSSN